MTIEQRYVRWTREMVYAVLETQRLPDDEGGSVGFNGFLNLGYVGNNRRTDETDELIASACEVMDWTPAMLVTWAGSTRGRHFLDWEPADISDAIRIINDDEEDVLRWVRDDVSWTREETA